MARKSRIAKLSASIFTLPITAIVVLFSISNRHAVDVQFWPLPGALNLPLYIISLVTLVFGLLLGSVITWVNAGESRQRARLAERHRQGMETKLSAARNQNEKIQAMFPPTSAPTK